MPARLSSFVNLSFSPLEPGNFYKRVYLLLRNQAPQVIHLYGSGYTEKRRPMPITPAFVSDYQIRELRGGTHWDAASSQRAAHNLTPRFSHYYRPTDGARRAARVEPAEGRG